MERRRDSLPVHVPRPLLSDGQGRQVLPGQPVQPAHLLSICSCVWHGAAGTPSSSELDCVLQSYGRGLLQPSWSRIPTCFHHLLMLLTIDLLEFKRKVFQIPNYFMLQIQLQFEPSCASTFGQPVCDARWCEHPFLNPVVAFLAPESEAMFFL